jgi:ADP-heptose:LPS heptosyltransferase
MLRVEDCLVRATGASRKIGNAGHAPFITLQERWWSDRFYTQLITTQAESMHELQRYAELLSAMDLKISEHPWKLKTVNDFPGITARPYLVIAPNASQKKRSWPLKNFLIAGYRIATQYHLDVVLIDEEKLSIPIRWPVEVRLESAHQSGLIDLCGKILTEDIPGVISSASLVICNDSGMMHLGVSLDRPTVAVGGSGMPIRYFPYPKDAQSSLKVVYKKVSCAGCDWKCIYRLPRNETAWCISQISWEEVVLAAQELMHQSGSMQSFKNAKYN